MSFTAGTGLSEYADAKPCASASGSSSSWSAPFAATRCGQVFNWWYLRHAPSNGRCRRLNGTAAIGREPRFTMCALSGRWANRARAGNGGLQAKSRIHTIGQLRSVSVAAQIARKRSFALLLFRWESQARWIAAPTGHAQWLFQDAREQAQG